MWKLPWRIEGTPVPKKKPTVKIGVELSGGMYHLLEDRATTKSTTVPALIRRAIAVYIILSDEVSKGRSIVVIKDRKVLKRIVLP